MELEEKLLSCVTPTYAPDTVRLTSRTPIQHHRELPFSVPQGSCAGPVLYSVYALTIQHIITNNQISLYCYAGDHGLRITCKPATESEISTVTDLQDCLSSVKDWMDENRLKMNSSKTEVIIFGSRQQLSKTITVVCA